MDFTAIIATVTTVALGVTLIWTKVGEDITNEG